jgi:hypothetical protein
VITAIMRHVYRLSDSLKELFLVLWLWLPVGFAYQPRRTVPVIASLTTYPPRISKSWMAIETLLRQSVRAERLVLVLNNEEFPTRDLPRAIKRQTRRGLEILWAERNGRSHDKLIPVRAKYPGATIVTFDDDKYFPRTLLDELVSASMHYPGHVIGARGWLVRRADEHGDVHFGLGWTRATAGSAGSNLFTPGGNGCLYPPDSLSSMVDDLDAALEVCPAADDIWFWGALQKNKSLVACLGLPAHRPVSSLKDGPALSSIDPLEEDSQFQHALRHFGIREQIHKASLPAVTDG